MNGAKLLDNGHITKNDECNAIFVPEIMIIA